MLSYIEWWIIVSKKFKGKTCVYCTKNPSEGADHIFAKEFFLVPLRGNLPKVPSCNKCNNKKSVFETYLLGILPFGGQHKDAKAHLTEKVPNRLKKNKKLKNEILKGQQAKWVLNPKGVIVRTKSLPFKPINLTKLAEFWVRGLMWHHWGVLVPQDVNLNILILTEFGEEMFEKECFSLNPNASVNENLGKGTIVYQGFQCTDNSTASAWRFQIFGGLGFSRNWAPTAQSNGIIGALLISKEK